MRTADLPNGLPARPDPVHPAAAPSAPFAPPAHDGRPAAPAAPGAAVPDGARVLVANPLASYQARAAEIDAAVGRVLRGGRYLLGPETTAFEQEFAAYVGVGHAVGAASGTEALHLALAALGVGPGDEVLTVAHTAVATASAIELCGARPRFVDVDPDHLLMDPDRLEAALTPRVRAVVPVHLYGQPAPLEPIAAFCRRHRLFLVEDCSQAHGAWHGSRRVGGWGQAAAFSFYPTKNLGALGDGGAVVTDDPALAERLRGLRQYGWQQRRYVSEFPGWNGRLDELQAAVLRVKLAGLDADNERRRAVAAAYAAELAGVAGLRLPAEVPWGRGVAHLYVVRTARRDELAGFLEAAGVQTLVHYPVPIHRQPAYLNPGPAPAPRTAPAQAGPAAGEAPSLPVTERAAGEVLSLPLYPELPAAHRVRVGRLVRAFFAAEPGRASASSSSASASASASAASTAA